MRAYELQKTIGIDGLVLNPGRPDPVPGPGEILVRMRAAALNYRDLMVSQGRYRGTLKPDLIPLSDGAGEVTAIGPGVSGFKPGDRVAGTFFPDWLCGGISAAAIERARGGSEHGMLAEYVVLHETGAVAAPDSLSFEEAATLPCAALTAWNAIVETGHVTAGSTVLLLGTGGVSMFALQFAKLHGARVILTSSSDEKLARAAALGADELVNYRTTPDWDREVLRLTGFGVDLVVEVGGAGTIERSLRSLRVGGTVAVIGVVAAAGGSVDPRALIGKAARLQGIYVGSREMFLAMNRAIAQCALRPVIDRVLPFEAAKDAYAYLSAGSHFGKLVVSV